MTFLLVVISALTLNAFAALIFLLVRLMPMKKLGLLSMWVVGTPVIIWAFNQFQSQALELTQAYPLAVSVYGMLAAVFSFCVYYCSESNLETLKFQKIICWILQCVGLVLKALNFIISWFVNINFIIITNLLTYLHYFLNSLKNSVDNGFVPRKVQSDNPRECRCPECLSRKQKKSSPEPMEIPERKSFCSTENLARRSDLFSPLRFFQQRAPLVSVKKYFTQEEFEKQNKRETALDLASLREQISSSPEPIKLLKKLHPDTRNKIINFSAGSDHIDSDGSSDSDVEVDSTEYEYTRKA